MQHNCNLMVNFLTKNTVDIKSDSLNFTVTFSNDQKDAFVGMQINVDGTEVYDSVQSDLMEASKYILSAFNKLDSE